MSGGPPQQLRRQRFGRPVARVVAALACVLGLAACSGDGSTPGPTATTSPQASATPTPTPTVTEPTKPVAARTPESAVAFVRYFWALYNYAYATGDAKGLESASEDGCKFCGSVLGEIRNLQQAGTSVRGYQAHVQEVASPPVEISDRALVVAVVSQDAGLEVPQSGTPKPLSSSSKIRFTFGLSWSNSSWKVHGVQYGTSS